MIDTHAHIYSEEFDEDRDEVILRAKEKGIDYQLEVMGGRTGTNADSIQNVAEGVKMGLLSIPLRNMHTAVELVDLHDIECTARLMAEYILQRGCRNA